MKNTSILLILAFLISCTESNETSKNNPPDEINKKLYKVEFQNTIDSAGVKGSVLIYDSGKDSFYSNDFKWAEKGQLPASTFKITNSIIGLETGVIQSDSTIFKWDGEKRRLKNWNQDLTLNKAFHFSCVPCYQEVARKIGVDKMRKYLIKLNYGKVQLDSTTLENFWLEGESKISQFEQVNFLQKFYKSELSISVRTENIMKKLMVIHEDESYKLSGKTGWSVTNNIDNGWFVGYIETNNNVYYFATNIEPNTDSALNTFAHIRKGVTFSALKKLKIIK